MTIFPNNTLVYSLHETTVEANDDVVHIAFM